MNIYTLSITNIWSNGIVGTVSLELPSYGEVDHYINSHAGSLLEVNLMPCDVVTRFAGMDVYLRRSDSTKEFRREYVVTDSNEIHGGSWILVDMAGDTRDPECDECCHAPGYHSVTSDPELADHMSNYQQAGGYDHDCVIQETPDGMGCVTCLYT